MNSNDKGRYADLILQALQAGRELNHNQREMLRSMAIDPDMMDYEIADALSVVVRRNPPTHCVMPETV